MSVMLLADTPDVSESNEEAAAIGSSGAPNTIATGRVYGAAGIGESQQGIKPEHWAIWLPDPTIGGKASPGNINAFATGQQSLNQNQATPTGLVADGAALSNPVIGTVGLTTRATRQYLGILGQVSNYGGSTIEGAAESVGIKLSTRGTNNA